jgi:hypothetical protein
MILTKMLLVLTLRFNWRSQLSQGSRRRRRTTSSKHRRNLKKTSTTDASLLSPKLRQHLRNRNTTISKQLCMAGLELLAKPR